jgi:hypothetical protein
MRSRLPALTPENLHILPPAIRKRSPKVSRLPIGPLPGMKHTQPRSKGFRHAIGLGNHRKETREKVEATAK